MNAQIEPKTGEPNRERPIGEGSTELTKEQFRRSLVFERDENRWEAAKDYKLPAIGDTVGNYQILAELGRGGFGAVYCARNLILGREEAIKLILPSAKTGCSDIEKRFEREIDIVSRLEHPNILTLYSSGTLSHNVLWMSTELIRGQRLDERIRSQGKMTLGKACSLMLQLLSGLMEAHGREIVHRDLKPSNIMLQDKAGYVDQVVILDFGLSKAIGQSENVELQNLTLADSKRLYGTPQYMAPEQFKLGNIGPWTDVYSAGLIFFELLTGICAIQGKTVFDVAYKQHFEEIELPPVFGNSPARQIIRKACAKNIEDRYKDAGEFYEAIRQQCQAHPQEDSSDGFHMSKTILLNQSPLSRADSHDKAQTGDIGNCKTLRLDPNIRKTADSAATPDYQPLQIDKNAIREIAFLVVQSLQNEKQPRRLSTSELILIAVAVFFALLSALILIGFYTGYFSVSPP